MGEMGPWFPTCPRPGETPLARFQLGSGALGRVWAASTVSGLEDGWTSRLVCIDEDPPLATHDVVFGNTPRCGSSRPLPMGPWGGVALGGGGCGRRIDELLPTPREARPTKGASIKKTEREQRATLRALRVRGAGAGSVRTTHRPCSMGGGEVRERLTAGAGWWPRAGSSSICSSVVWRPAPRCVARSLVAEDVSRMRVRRSGAYQTVGVRKLQSQKCHFCAGNKGSRLSVCGLPIETRRQPQAGVRSGRRTRR